MNLPIIFMFSGQGSQYYQMGRDLFFENEIFKKEILQLDRAYQDLTGLSVIKHLYDDQNMKSEPFTQTLLTHPAIFMVECALAKVLLENNIRADFVLGASLGEFSAAVVAGALNIESALQMVAQQAQDFKYCPEGSMLAILENSAIFHQESYLHQFSELAAVNFNSHFVVAGNKENLNNIKKQLDERNIVSQTLPVSYAFHSSLIDNAKTPFLEGIKSIQLKTAKLPVISCAEGKTITSLTSTHFWNIVRAPILFQSAIQYLENQQPAFYLDVGPSGTLATFVKYNLAKSSLSKQSALLTPYGGDIKNLQSILKNMEIKN